MIVPRRVLLQNARRQIANTRTFASTTVLQNGRAAAYRRLVAQPFLTASELNQHSLSSSTSIHPFIPIGSNVLGRPFSTFRPLQQKEAPKEDVKDPPRTEGEETKKAQDDGKTAKEGETAEDGKSGNDGEKSQEKGEGEGEGAKKEEKKESAPPPPHGDKTPWQVFTETLKTEFKASQEWNDSTKQLAGEVQSFRESEGVKKAKAAYEATAGPAASAVKATGRAIGHSAAWTWDTSVVQGVRKGVNATGRGIEKATRPVRETKAFQDVAKALDDGSSSRYGGWVEKEERRKKREERELSDRLSGKRTEKIEEDPNAGTNITLHKDAAWKEQWNSFKEKSKMMQGIFAMKNTYEESENPLISTARSITDRIAGFFAENETAMVIKKFREMDPNFQMEPFLREMREYILPEVLDAYVKADVEVLKQWLSAAQFQVYSALMEQYNKAGLKSDGKVLDIRHVDVLSARILDPGDIPVFIITCRTQEVHVYRNKKTNQLAAGMEDKVQLVTYAIGVTRLPDEVNNPETRGWRMIELHKAARDYI